MLAEAFVCKRKKQNNMKRVIKFRGRCTKSNDWVCGDLIHGVGHKSGNMYILPNKINLAYVKHCDPLDGVKVIPETISQFTGLIDKNGIEIFEGDIVIYSNVFSKDRKYLVPEIRDCFLTNEIGYELEQRSGALCEIIGNVFENPELIEGSY